MQRCVVPCSPAITGMEMTLSAFARNRQAERLDYRHVLTIQSEQVTPQRTSPDTLVWEIARRDNA